MVMSRQTIMLFAVAALMAAAAVVRADQAAAQFNKLYADNIRNVGASIADTSDDLALARVMVAEAPKHRSEPALMTLICDRAYKLARQDPAGADTAIQAMQLLADTVPAQELTARQNVVDLRSTQYTQARGPDKARVAERLIDETVALGEVLEQSNDYNAALLTYRKAGSIALATRSTRVKLIQAGISAAAERQQRYNLMQRLHERYEKEPDNASLATQLARMYLFDFDDPTGAAPYAAKSDDAAIRQNVALIQQPIKTLDADQARTLGTWYQGKGFLSDPAMRGALHLRAHVYFRRAYDAADGKDSFQRQVLAALDTLNLSLQEVGITPPPTPMLAVAEPVKPAPDKPAPTQPHRPTTVVVDSSPANRPQMPNATPTAANDPSQAELLRRPVDDPTQPRRGRPTFFGIPAN